MRALDGNGIEEGEFKTFEMDLIIPSMHSSTFENIEKFMNVDVNSFQQSSRDFVIQGEMLKLFLVLQPPKNTTTKLPPKPPKDDLTAHMHPSIGYHVDVRLRNPEDFAKTSSTPSSSSSKTVSKSVMISNPKHGHVRHTPKLNSEYDTETAMGMDSDTQTSTTSSEATATTLTATTISSGTSTPINSPSTSSATTSSMRDSSEELPRGPLADFIVINSPAGTVKAKNGSKPNFFRLPDGTIIFPIEIPVGVKTKYNNKDISVVVSVARVMQPPAAGNTSGKMINENILHLPFPGSSPMSQHHVTSATKLEKLLSAQYPQYWQYSQYSRGGIGALFSPPASFGSSFSPNSDSKSNIHGSHSNPNLFGLSSLLRTNSASSNPSVPSTPTPATSSSLTVPNTLSNSNSRSDPNIASLSSSSEDTLSPLPSISSNLSTSTTNLPSRGSSGNLYGMGQIQTSTSSATLSLANMATATGQSGTTNSNLTTNLGVTSGAPVAIKTAQKIVRVLEPLQVRLLQHYTPSALKLGTKRLIPVAVSNTHPTLSIVVRSLQLVLSNIPSLEGGNSMAVGPGPDVTYNNVSVTDKYKTSTLDIETFPVVVTPGDEYHFVVSVEPQTPSSSSLSTSSLSSEASALMPPPPASAARAGGGNAAKRRVIYTLQAQLVITWSIPCSPGSILSIHPLPVAFPSRHDLLVSFDSKSPVRANNIFNVCFTITNLSDYSRDLTFIIPRPVCVPTSSSSPSPSSLTSTSSNRSLPARFSPPARSNTLPSIRFTPPSTPSSSASASPASGAFPPPRTPSAHNVHQSASTPSFSVTASASASSIPSLVPSPSFSSSSSSTPDLSRPVSGPSSARTAVLANDTTVDEEDLLIRFGELQANSASMLCLEKTLYVGLVPRNSSVSVNVRYIPIREGLFEIQGLQIFDRANDQMYVVQDTCQLYVIA